MQPQYQALYRRFRPQRFADVYGQPHVQVALRNAVRDGKVAHAYLFSGPRGTGKTSTARILAMALNCESPVDGEPDGTCPSCRDIRVGGSLSVLELDAASNRKIDDMRELLSHVGLGSPGRWRVYIIDEVHQLTADAASALLKTLEEPPSHVVFVLATTEQQKVMPTIISRTQSFGFHLLDRDTLGTLVSEVNEQAHLGLSPSVLELAVQRGQGSARDTLSALDQLAAVGGMFTLDNDVAGIVEALTQQNVGAVLQAVATNIMMGQDARQCGTDLARYLREMFLSIQAPALMSLPQTVATRAAEQAKQMGMVLLARSLEALGRSLVDMRNAVDPRVTLEIALIGLARPPAAGPAPASASGAPHDSQLTGRLEQLEQRVERIERQPAAAPTAKPASSTAKHAAQPAPAPPSPAPAPAVEVPASPPAPMPIPPGTMSGRDELTKAWGDIVLHKLSPLARAILGNGRFIRADEDGTTIFALPTQAFLGRSAPYKQEAQEALAAHMGRPIQLQFVIDRERHPSHTAEDQAATPSPSALPEPSAPQEPPTAPTWPPAANPAPAAAPSVPPAPARAAAPAAPVAPAAPAPPTGGSILDLFPGAVIDE